MTDIKITVRDARDIPAKLAQIFDLVSRGIKGGAVMVTLGRPTRSLNQNAKFHVMLTDIAKAAEFEGKKYPMPIWKEWLADEFEQEMLRNGEELRKPGRMLPSLDGRRVLLLRAKTSDFDTQEGAKFIEFLYAYGTEEWGIQFSDSAMAIYESYKEAQS